MAKRSIHNDIYENDNFTGDLWFEKLDISILGKPVGIGPLSQCASDGMSYHMHWGAGTVQRVDVYSDGRIIHYKEFEYDEKKRVVVNTMFSQDTSGAWSIQDDVWYYTYDLSTGKRLTKTMRVIGEATARKVIYDDDGNSISEEIITDHGYAQDRYFSYAKKFYDYDKDGIKIGERWFNVDDDQIPVV